MSSTSISLEFCLILRRKLSFLGGGKRSPSLNAQSFRLVAPAWNGARAKKCRRVATRCHSMVRNCTTMMKPKTIKNARPRGLVSMTWSWVFWVNVYIKMIHTKFETMRYSTTELRRSASLSSNSECCPNALDSGRSRSSRSFVQKSFSMPSPSSLRRPVGTSLNSSLASRILRSTVRWGKWENTEWMNPAVD